MEKLFEVKEDEQIVDTVTTRHALFVITNKAIYMEKILDSFGRYAKKEEK